MATSGGLRAEVRVAASLRADPKCQIRGTLPGKLFRRMSKSGAGMELGRALDAAIQVSHRRTAGT